MLNFNDLFPLFASLIGFPALIAALCNLLKFFGWLPDSAAPQFVFWLNLAGFAGLAVLYFMGNLPLITQIDAQLGSVALFILSFIAFITQLKGAALYHNLLLRGQPFIGYSHTIDHFRSQKG